MTQPMRVAVFCGSSNDADPNHLQLATEVGNALAAAGIGVVYGGGHSGLMGAVARAAMDADGEVVGVIPGGLFTNGIAEDEITELHVVDDMHERKARMYDLADGFLGLPGGLGTFEEIFEAATWTQLGLHDGARAKPVVLLDDDGFWAPAVGLLDNASRAGLLRPQNRDIISAASSPGEAIARLRAAPAVERDEFVNAPIEGA